MFFCEILMMFTVLCNCCKRSKKGTKVTQQAVVPQTREEGSSPISPCKVQFIRLGTFTNPSRQDVVLTSCFYMLLQHLQV
jgi:hypothetical protein